mgnify:FL=1
MASKLQMQDPRWMRCGTTNTFSTVGDTVTVSGLYKFNSGAGIYVYIGDPVASNTAINQYNASIVASGSYVVLYQYVAQGQMIKANTSSGNYQLMHAI